MTWNLPNNSTTDIYSLINKISSSEGVDPKLIHALVKTESSYNPMAQPPINPNTGKRASSAKGLMQLIDGTAAKMNVQDPFDPEQNLTGGIRYLKQHLNATGGDVPKALAMYNQGPAGDLSKANDYVNKIKKNYSGDGSFLNQDFSTSQNANVDNTNNINDNIGEKPFMNNLNRYLGSLNNTNQGTNNQNYLSNIPEAAPKNKILGMKPNDFIMLAGSLGSAFSGDTPIGRASAATAAFAGYKNAQEQKLSDMANEQSVKEATENRGYKHDANMLSAKLLQDDASLDKKLIEQKKLSELEYTRGAADREQQQNLRGLQIQKYKQDLNEPNLSHVVNNDGTVTFLDKFGTVVKQTAPGIGPSARINKDERFVNPETSSQINQTINDRSLTNAKITYDKDLGYSDAVTGKPIDNAQVYKIKKFNDAISSDVINYMNAKKVYTPEAYDKVLAGHAFNAAERALKSNSIDGIKAVLDQYPSFMHPQINDMMKRLNANQQSQQSQ